jgi:hypothetical protein
MSTITISNLTDTPVAGETDLRQAVAEADSGDTIVLASGDFGEFIQLKSPLTVTGTNLTIDFGAGQDNEIDDENGKACGRADLIAKPSARRPFASVSASPGLPPSSCHGRRSLYPGPKPLHADFSIAFRKEALNGN